ncbi:MAG: alanine--glyoxylate aminotransferase family protein [Elusimicrobiota bacterium]
MKKHYLLTPGPAPVPAAVLQEEALPIIHHRTSEFSEVFTTVRKDLQYVFKTENETILFASSGTGAMEASVVNLLSPGDKAIVLSAGVFGDRWTKIIKEYGLEPVVVRAESGKAVDLGQVEKVLKDHPQAKAVFTTFTDTSTAVLNDIKNIGRLVSSTDAVLVVDAISGLGADEYHSDQWNVDITVSASQKGLMNVPGLAFLSVSEKAWKLIEKAKLPRFYWDLRKARVSLATKETPFTPAVSLIVGMRKALQIIREEGLENVWQRHRCLALAARAGIRALGLKTFSQSPCNLLTSAYAPEGIDGGKIVKKLREEYGVSIAGGQAELKGKIFRIAHVGYMDKFDVIVGLSALEMGLKGLGYPVELGKAVAAAEGEFLK